MLTYLTQTKRLQVFNKRDDLLNLKKRNDLFLKQFFHKFSSLILPDTLNVIL